MLDPKAEAEHQARCNAAAADAVLQLRDTLKPGFDFKAQGYESVEHARLTIIQMVDRQINKLCADHFRKAGQ